MPLPSVFQGVQDCRLTGLKPSKRFRRPPRQQLLQLHARRSVFQGVQACRLPARKTPQMLPCSSQSTCSCRTLTPTCPCHLFFRGFKTAVCPASNPPNASAGLQGNNSYSYMPLPSVFQGVQDCRLTGLKPSKRFRRPPRQQLLQLHAPAICFSGSSRLPFDRPETLQTLPQASEATTLTATCPAICFSGSSSLPFASPQNPPNPAICFSGSSSLPFASPQNPPNAPLQLPIYMLLPNSYTYMPLPSVFQGVQDCRLPGLKPPKRFRRPPRQQLLQLYALFREFKTAV